MLAERIQNAVIRMNDRNFENGIGLMRYSIYTTKVSVIWGKNATDQASFMAFFQLALMFAARAVLLRQKLRPFRQIPAQKRDIFVIRHHLLSQKWQFLHDWSNSFWLS